jgi:hypothetical protein
MRGSELECTCTEHGMRAACHHTDVPWLPALLALLLAWLGYNVCMDGVACESDEEDDEGAGNGMYS